jgi:alpha-N-arabinofuranosidase
MKKQMLLGAALALTMSTAAQTKLLTDGQEEFQIPAEIYGQFAEHLGRCIYDGIWVGKDSKIPNTDGYRTDVFNALKDLQIPVLRWPGGCFADTYHWRDGIGPTSKRPRIKNVFWGGTMEDNSFGTDEFFTLCERLGCKTYLSVNVGSGTVKDMNDWLEYITGTEDCPNVNLRKQNGREKPYKIDFMGIGNESWGCGGNMTPEFYSDLYRQYSGYAHLYSNNTYPVRVASGSNDFDYNWTKVLMQKCHNNMEHISLHYYVLPIRDWSGSKGPDRGFGEEQYFTVIRDGYKMDELVKKHIDIIQSIDKRIKLDVDEWGIWTDQEPGSIPGHLYQQNTMRDALLASTTFDIFHKYANNLGMCNIAQIVNVLQAMVLTKDDKMVLTPTYHVFKMYAVHQNAQYIPLSFHSPKYTFNGESIDAISATLSKKNGVFHLSLSNVDSKKENTVTIDLSNINASTVAKAEIITSKSFNDFNSFDNPNVIKINNFDGASAKKGVLTVKLPPMSIVTIELK